VIASILLPCRRPCDRITGRLAGLWLAGLLAAPAVGAQGVATGVIARRVTNSATGHNLEGAEVVATPGNRSVLTARDGGFELRNVPPGAYTLTVSYAGLDSKQVPANVTAGGTTSHEIGLSSEVYQLSRFVVEGDREGNALAITQQRNAPNVKNVIAADAFGNIADLNLGNT